MSPTSVRSASLICTVTPTRVGSDSPTGAAVHLMTRDDTPREAPVISVSVDDVEAGYVLDVVQDRD